MSLDVVDVSLWLATLSSPKKKYTVLCTFTEKSPQWPGTSCQICRDSQLIFHFTMIKSLEIIPPHHPWEFPLYHLASDVQLITQRGRLCNCLHMHLLQLNILSNVDTDEWGEGQNLLSVTAHTRQLLPLRGNGSTTQMLSNVRLGFGDSGNS